MSKIPTMDEMAKQLAENALDNFLCNGKSLREWMTIIVSEDAISREAVLEQTYDWCKDEFLRVTNPFDYLRKRIKSLPPVTPTSSKMEQVEDAISKAEVIKLIDKHTNDDGTLDDDITCILEELPPIQPKAKVGKWIVDQDAFSEINGYILKCHCSECYHKKEFYDHKSIKTPTLKNTSFIDNYCPNCGAEMMGVEK